MVNARLEAPPAPASVPAFEYGSCFPGGFPVFWGTMKLTFRTVELRLAHTWTIARSPGTNTARVVVLELTAPDGNLGRGEAAPIARYNESIESVQAFLAKLDPGQLSFDDIEGSMRYLETVSNGDAAARCAVNIALLDGAARKAGRAIYDFLGLGFRDNHHVSSFTIGIDKPDVIRKKVIEADRFPVLKMKVGVAGDKENMAALREISPVKPVRVDANEGWKTKEEALAMLEWLASDGHIQYCEQPMPATAPVKDWVWLKERTPLPIFGDESYHTAADLSVAAECFHGVNVKLAKSSGISGGFHALQAARKAGLKTMIGCMIETSILISAAAHLAELCDYLDIDGNILITNDPYQGVAEKNGVLSFSGAPEPFGLRVAPR